MMRRSQIGITQNEKEKMELNMKIINNIQQNIEEFQTETIGLYFNLNISK